MFDGRLRRGPRARKRVLRSDVRSVAELRVGIGESGERGRVSGIRVDRILKEVNGVAQGRLTPLVPRMPAAHVRVVRRWSDLARTGRETGRDIRRQPEIRFP